MGAHNSLHHKSKPLSSISSDSNKNHNTNPKSSLTEDPFIHVYFLIKNMKPLLPDVAILICRFYFKQFEANFSEFWHNNVNLKILNSKNNWELTTETSLGGYTVIQSKSKIGKFPLHFVFNTYLGGDIWIGISEYSYNVGYDYQASRIHGIEKPDNIAHQAYNQGYGWWHQAGFTSVEYRGDVQSSSPFDEKSPVHRIFNLYVDPTESKLYWIVNDKLLFTHEGLLDHRSKPNISEMHLTMCLHHGKDRISIESVQTIPHSVISNVLKKISTKA
jgi:hypothetical protein